MNCKELYDSFMEYSRTGNYESAEGVAISWLNQEANNPFQIGTHEHELFAKASRAFKKWQAKGIDSRISRIRMAQYVKELGSLNALNPYNPVDSGFRVLGVESEKEPVKEHVVVETAEKEHVLGVVPDNKQKLFNNRRKKR